MSRPRGFTDWRPQARTLPLLEAVQAVLQEYRDFLPLTLRQVFYRLVGKDIIGKTEQEYKQLGELLNRARRAQIVPMSAIRDDGFTGGTATRLGYIDPSEFIADTLSRAQYFRLDRQAGQDERLVVWCEAAGMVPQLKRVASPYGITVKSSGGFDSTTVKHDCGRFMPGVHVLHVGDYDPSGECMFDALAEDITAFAAAYENEIRFTRLAVTPEHIRRYNLPTAPPKASTHQAKKGLTETTQAEALDPATLAAIVQQGIEDNMDLNLYRQVVETERQERETLLTRLEALREAA